MSHSTSFSRFSFELPTSSPEQAAALRPHRSSDSSFRAVKLNPSFRDFSLVRQIGSGDIGRVFLCRLRGAADDGRLYAMKVVDNDVLALKKKTERVETERKIMRLLDHPFLPTLFAEFEASNFSCVVMEYCSGGDLHSLRHKQPQKRFSISSARFYAAEVLVALEYLHMLGIIYRDLKPENVLVRSDGHIMLTDFDLSLCSDAIAAIESPDFSPAHRPRPKHHTPPVHSPRSPASPAAYSGRGKSKRSPRTSGLWPNPSTARFVAEPVHGPVVLLRRTHEYVAPEVALGGSHGNAVGLVGPRDLHLRDDLRADPVRGPYQRGHAARHREGASSVPVRRAVRRERGHARDLISGLLSKDPNRRLGSKRGAADVKTHPFFKGLNFALIRSVTPPTLGGDPETEDGAVSSTDNAVFQYLLMFWYECHLYMMASFFSVHVAPR
ncbi:protein kinase pinoid [Phtheirospermum japonicum]|uniref:non-specific serine/threonine protein kinase n=1 Tax=Phtheirospermum japonicum TaxID=374723 RepID=A0A830B861_9LAMI|nr:protein kinase pinoid [Phtheirospermum japonicum]